MINIFMTAGKINTLDIIANKNVISKLSLYNLFRYEAE